MCEAMSDFIYIAKRGILVIVGITEPENEKQQKAKTMRIKKMRKGSSDCDVNDFPPFSRPISGGVRMS